jgi:hypothetical protein
MPRRVRVAPTTPGPRGHCVPRTRALSTAGPPRPRQSPVRPPRHKRCLIPAPRSVRPPHRQHSFWRSDSHRGARRPRHGSKPPSVQALCKVPWIQDLRQSRPRPIGPSPSAVLLPVVTSPKQSLGGLTGPGGLRTCLKCGIGILPMTHGRQTHATKSRLLKHPRRDRLQPGRAKRQCEGPPKNGSLRSGSRPEYQAPTEPGSAFLARKRAYEQFITMVRPDRTVAVGVRWARIPIRDIRRLGTASADADGWGRRAETARAKAHHTRLRDG